MASDDDLEMGDQPIDVSQRHHAKMIAAISVNGLVRVIVPSPLSGRT